jgi:hypothetical protein
MRIDELDPNYFTGYLPGEKLPNGARMPTDPTLKKYGLTRSEWAQLAWAGCNICGHVPPSGTMHVDHQHVRGFKKLDPMVRRLHVRGVLCWTCNSVILRRGISPTKLRLAADYLERYERWKENYK